VNYLLQKESFGLEELFCVRRYGFTDKTTRQQNEAAEVAERRGGGGGANGRRRGIGQEYKH